MATEIAHPTTREASAQLKSRLYAVKKELKYWNQQPASAMSQRRIADLERLYGQIRDAFDTRRQAA